MNVETALTGYLEKTINSKEHKSKAEALALDPQIIKGEDYRARGRECRRRPCGR
jgi:hypothetical protein